MNLGPLTPSSLAATVSPTPGGRIDFTLDQPASPHPQPQRADEASSLSSFDIVTAEENAAITSAFVRPESGYRNDGRTTAGPHPIGQHLDLSV